MYNLNVIVVLEFISRDLYLLFAILLSSKFQNSFFYQHIRPKSGLKFPRPFSELSFIPDVDLSSSRITCIDDLGIPSLATNSSLISVSISLSLSLYIMKPGLLDIVLACLTSSSTCR